MKLCFELIVNLISNMNRNRNILKTISSRGLSMNNIVRTDLVTDTQVYLYHFYIFFTRHYIYFLCVRNDKANSFAFFHTRDSSKKNSTCYAMSKMPPYIFSKSRNLSSSLVLSYRSKRIANNSYRIVLSIA